MSAMNRPSEVPPEVLDSYPGTAYFDPRFHWQELKVHTQIVSHNRPEERPALRKYEQARVLPDSPERTRLYQDMTKLVLALFLLAAGI